MLILIARGGGSLEDLAGFKRRGSRARHRGVRAAGCFGHRPRDRLHHRDFVATRRRCARHALAPPELITSARQTASRSASRRSTHASAEPSATELMLARQRLTALSVAQMQNRLQALIGRRSQRLDDSAPLALVANRTCARAPASLRPSLARTEWQNPRTLRLALARAARSASHRSAASRSAPSPPAPRGSSRATARLDAPAAAVLQSRLRAWFTQPTTGSCATPPKPIPAKTIAPASPRLRHRRGQVHQLRIDRQARCQRRAVQTGNNGHRVPKPIPRPCIQLHAERNYVALALRECRCSFACGCVGGLVWRVQEAAPPSQPQKSSSRPLEQRASACFWFRIPLSVAVGGLRIPPWGCCVRLSAAAHIAPGARRRSHHDAAFQRLLRLS